MHLTITGYSTALFSTWYFIEELRLLFDAGDGVAASLLQKSRKVEHVFISHADRDHLTGLLRFNELNARPGFPQLYFPADAGSFAALETFSKQFDTRVNNTVWQGITDGDSVPIQKELFVQAFRNNHVVRAKPHEVKSLGFQVYQVKHKLKAEFLPLPPTDIIRLMADVGRDKLTDEVRTNLLAYSGDTPTDDLTKWNNTQVLIHEATFLTNAERATLDTTRNAHSTLEDVLQQVSALTIGTLILGHFSSRYSDQEIDEAIRRFCQAFHIQIPVHRLLPGQTHWNILAGTPINHDQIVWRR